MAGYVSLTLVKPHGSPISFEEKTNSTVLRTPLTSLATIVILVCNDERGNAVYKSFIQTTAIITALLSVATIGLSQKQDEIHQYQNSKGNSVIITGQLPKANQMVTGIIWPPGETREQIYRGDSLAINTTVSTISDAQGYFELVIPWEGVAKEVIGDFQHTDLEIISYADGNIWAQNVTLYDPSSTAYRDSYTTASPISLKNLNKAYQVSALNEEIMATSPYCVITVLSTDYGRKATVGGAVSSLPGTKIEFSYSSGTTTTLGVAVSASGSMGSWSASGTSTRSTTSTVSYGTITTATRPLFETSFTWQKTKKVCDIPGQFGQPGFTTISYHYNPIAWGGGGTIVANGQFDFTPPSAYCASYSANVGIHKTSTTASTYSTGAQVSLGIGINLSSQSGYSSSTSIKMTMPSHTGGQICGLNGSPGGNSGTLKAKP